MGEVLSPAVCLIKGLMVKGEKVHVKDLKHYWSIDESAVSGPLSPYNRDENKGTEVPGVDIGSPKEDRRRDSLSSREG